MTNTSLKANTLTFFESLIMGVAGSAPGFAMAVAISGLVGAAGIVSVNALLIFAVPMFGIAVAYKGMNQKMVHAGAGYEWTKQFFGGFFGFFSGWALLISAMVFMATGSVPLGTATLDLFDPNLANNVVLTTSIGTVWFIAVGLIVISGIGITGKVQVFMSSIELIIIAIISVSAFFHAHSFGSINQFSWSWFSFNYPPKTFAASAMIVVFMYWGWDVTSNLGEETKEASRIAGSGGFYSVIVTMTSFIAFTIAVLLLFSLSDAAGFSDNLMYHVAIQAGLGHVGGLAASLALILSSVATLETTMLQFSRTLFAMGRDRSMPAVFGVIQEKTQTPVYSMYALLAIGLVLTFLSSFMPSVGKILTDAISATAIQVCYYYGLAGLVCAWVFRKSYTETIGTWALYACYPFLSALSLFILGFYAISTFDLTTKVVGLGGLLVGIIFYRPKGYRAPIPIAAE